MRYVMDWWETLATPDPNAEAMTSAEGTTVAESELPPERVQELTEEASMEGYFSDRCWVRLEALAPGSFRLVGHGTVIRGPW